jgi:hypothetical protein
MHREKDLSWLNGGRHEGTGRERSAPGGHSNTTIGFYSQMIGVVGMNFDVTTSRIELAQDG